MTTTTLQKLRKAGACVDGYNRVVRALQRNEFSCDYNERESYIRFQHKEEIPLLTILESNGLNDALWSLKACDQTPELIRKERLFAVWCARQVQHLMTDERSIAAMDVAERHANGMATDEELAAAAAASWAAADAASWAAAAAAGWAAADADADAASWTAADAASWAAADAAAAAAAQKAKFIEMFCQ